MQLLRETTGADDAQIVQALKTHNDRYRQISMLMDTDRGANSKDAGCLCDVQ